MTKTKTYNILSLLLLLCATYPLGAQNRDTLSITLKANVTRQSIQLRWSATSPSAWYYTNKNGVTIERYTLMRNDAILDIPEKILLTPIPIKPPVLNAWKSIAPKDNYAAIIAQALYGKDFEVSGGQKGVSAIIALSQEQQQRFAMAMYAADLSYPAAIFAGWGYEDKTAVKGERYLYRIIPIIKNMDTQIEPASVYVGLEDYQKLPKPYGLDARFSNSSVLLTWNYQLLLPYYNTYHVERSEDGRQFKRLNNNPITNITDSERIFYTDTITNGKNYHYRVIGLTPFGEEGPVSDTISGMGVQQLIHTPQITRMIPDKEGNIRIEWAFDASGNKDISAFEIQRSDTDKGPFETIIKDISSDKRIATYTNPLPENYIRIAAIAKEGEPTHSFANLLQIPDSIPPSVPQVLTGEVDSLGIINLSWQANTEADLLGYRVFRGQIEGEEFVPLNDIAIRTNQFTDTVSLHNLNAKVYYTVTAIDRRYNQSAQSSVLTLVKPLKVKPAAPYIKQIESTEKGICLEWVAGNDETIISYTIWRSAHQGDKNKTRIALVDNPQTTFYEDANLQDGVTYYYQVKSINQGNIESDPSPEAYALSKTKGTTLQLIKKFTGSRSEKGIALKWELTSREFNQISIYRKEPESSFYLWKELGIWDNETLDNKAKRNTTYDYMLVVKDLQERLTHKQIKID